MTIIYKNYEDTMFGQALDVLEQDKKKQSYFGKYVQIHIPILFQTIGLEVIHRTNIWLGMKELNREGLAQASISRDIDKFVKLGLLKRRENPKNRKEKQISLTQYGRFALKDIYAMNEFVF
jgi:hypothetical protein